MAPAAGDGPAFPKVTVPLTVEPATADGGSVSVVVTSASGETALVADALSGSVFGPCAVDVPMPLVIVVDPPAGAV